ncbi:MAG: VOC family protein [Ignavibacteriae bacterium]|nr:MAG: VOC family protein [Ignavibacteriota bacterium]
MPRVVHFEIGAQDTEKIKNFYKNVFEWEYTKWGEGDMEYILVKTGDGPAGINGGIFKSKGESTIVNTIDVPNLEQYIEKVKENGGEQVVPKNVIPGVGYFAYCKDCEGNLIGLMQPDENAGK